MNGKKDLEKIIAAVRDGDNFFITTHLHSDVDSVASELALAYVLQGLNKKFRIINNELPPDNTLFLRDCGLIEPYGKTPGGAYEIGIILDCCDWTRLSPDIIKILKKIPLIINIDHHAGNSGLGSLNFIDKEAASTGELIYTILKEGGFKINTDIAVCLYMSIADDTGSFRYANTGASAFRICLELIESGIKPNVIADQVFETNRFSKIKLLGLVLSRAELELSGRVACSAILKRDLEDSGGTIEDTDGIINHLRSVKGAEAAVLFREEDDGHFKVSLRAKGELDVHKIARVFGGGGHKPAAGCLVKGTLAEVKNTIMGLLEKELSVPGAAALGMLKV